jgi:hypothetical protein
MSTRSRAHPWYREPGIVLPTMPEPIGQVRLVDEHFHKWEWVQDPSYPDMYWCRAGFDLLCTAPSYQATITWP